MLPLLLLPLPLLILPPQPPRGLLCNYRPGTAVVRGVIMCGQLSGRFSRVLGLNIGIEVSEVLGVIQPSRAGVRRLADSCHENP